MASSSGRRRERTKPKPSAWKGSLRLALLFVTLVGVNVYIFVFGKTSIHNLIARIPSQSPAPGEPAQPSAPGAPGLPAVVAPPPAAPPAVSAKGRKPAAGALVPGAPPSVTIAPPGTPGAASSEVLEVPEEGRVVQNTVLETDTLSAILKRENVAPAAQPEILAALTKVLDARTVRAGQTYALRFDGEDQLKAFEYRTTPVTLYRVERTNNRARAAGETEGKWKAVTEHAPLDTRVGEVGGVIESSLYDAVRRSGESTSLVSFFVDMFAWDINFYIDTQPGDRFKLVVEKLYLGDKFYKYGRVLAAEYSGKVGTYRAFWYESKPGQGGGSYYNEKGEAVAKSLLKTPLKFVRISSSFDRHRFHPILHTERAHLGVDYAAPTGTPVWATTSGRVSFKGNKGGAGECVMISHAGGMESIYMHLSKFAKGLAVGQQVRQKQVIGYVGATGLATGPHLHFSVKMGGHFVDPLRLHAAREAPLPVGARGAFKEAIKPRLEAFARLDERPPPAPTASAPVPAPTATN